MANVTKQQYVALVKSAEDKLIAAGNSDLEKRIHMLTGIYYGTAWSLDFKVESSAARNKLFEAFLGRGFDDSDDPRPAIGADLFGRLQRAQDAGGVDMGHLLIGLDARMRDGSRQGTTYGLQASGLELVTWAGDLGGGAARLAFDEGRGTGSVGRYFSGTDYGANSNLEGDIASYVVGSIGQNSLAAPVLPGGKIADGLAQYFYGAKNTEWSNRKARFQQIIAGTPSTSASQFASKIKSFANVYYVSRVGRDNASHPVDLAAGSQHLNDASDAVARRFMTWLSAGHGAHH